MAKIQTVNQLISVFKDIATRHYQINGFGIGDNWEVGASEAKMHPVLWINPVAANMPESEMTGYKAFEIDFEIRVFDLVNKDESNEYDAMSDCIDILKDIIIEFNKHPYYVKSQLSIIDDITFEPFTEEFDEETTGWVADISMRTPVINSFCGIPMADITGFEFPGTDCPDVNSVCPVTIQEITGVSPIIVTSSGNTRQISFSGASGGGSITSGNGISLGASDIIELGGTLTKDTTLDFDTNFLTFTGGNIVYRNGGVGLNPNIAFGAGNGKFAQIGIEYIASQGINFWTPSGSDAGLQNNIAFIHDSGYFKQRANTTPIVDANLVNNEMSLHVNGSKLAGRYKDNSGTVTDISFGNNTADYCRGSKVSGNLTATYATSDQVVPITVESENSNSTKFTIISDGIRVNQAGRYRVNASSSITALSNTARANPIVTITVNGVTSVDANNQAYQSLEHYGRNAGSSRASTGQLDIILDLAANDIVKIVLKVGGINADTGVFITSEGTHLEVCELVTSVGTVGFSGTYQIANGNTVTVTNGIITSVA